MTDAVFDHLCREFRGQHAVLLPVIFGLYDQDPLLWGPHTLEFELSAPTLLPETLKREVVLLLGSSSPPGIRHSHSCMRPCKEQVRQDIQPPTSFVDRTRQTRWGKLRAGWGQKQCGSGQARYTRKSKNAEEKKKQMWEGGRKPSHGDMSPWGCRHLWLIYSLRQESSNCFLKRPKCKYFQLCGPYGLCHNYSILPCSADTAIDNTYMYEHGCVSINVFLQKQVAGWI